MSVYDINRISVPPAPPEYNDDTDDRHFVPAPCQVACPVGTDAPSYLAYIWEGKFKEAFEAITATNPFSSICGRVCDAPCEPACRRTASDGPIMIRNLKRFVMDKVGHRYDPPSIPVTRKKTIGIIGGGPTGLTAAHDLCEMGYEVHVYEMTDRLGGLMVWGIPAFRCPPGVIKEDIDRLTTRCPGLKVHLNRSLGQDISLTELKHNHDAVLLAIGAWWGKQMQIPGEQAAGVVDGVGFLRKVNDGERPHLPETVIVIGGGDVAMDACRVAKRLPGCKNVKVIYRRGPKEIPARRIELEGAIEEGVEFIYNTLQVRVERNEHETILHCVKTKLGKCGEDGRRHPIEISGSEHTIRCGMVIAAVGQQAECAELNKLGMMLPDRVRADFSNMRTSDPKVFAAGDGAFGGSTIVMAMHHGQKAAYYINAFLETRSDPLPYRTPYRTRRVPVAQDLRWEILPQQEPEFFGLGKKPTEFPEIESTYNLETARKEAARCYRCDAETGSSDYSIQHREDIFSMARAGSEEHLKQKVMINSRLKMRDNPFPEGREATIDDLVFLPANLSRLVIDPYREECSIETTISSKLSLAQPFLVSGFDYAPEEIREALASALAKNQCSYIGMKPIGNSVPWCQVLDSTGHSVPSPQAAAQIHKVEEPFQSIEPIRLHSNQILGLAISSRASLEYALSFALDKGFDMLLLDGAPGPGHRWPELGGAPHLEILRDAIRILRRLNSEEAIDLVYFGGVRSGTDAAKLIALGATAVVLELSVALALGGQITKENGVEFTTDRSREERTKAVQCILDASTGEASMMARCTGKTNLHNLEPEDLRSITLATAESTGIPLVGLGACPAKDP